MLASVTPRVLILNLFQTVKKKKKVSQTILDTSSEAQRKINLKKKIHSSFYSYIFLFHFSSNVLKKMFFYLFS